MLINGDIKGLEWVAINWFAQDRVGMEEILNDVDQHSENQKAFGLPERRIAKIFVFRLIYGGSKWAYVLDPDFNWVSKDPEFWQGIIDKFYGKYDGIKRQHEIWIRDSQRDGKLVMPTGRIYHFKYEEDRRGNAKWPVTKVVNYPVQGLGHDLVTIARVSLRRRLDESPWRDQIKLISTVHDSIVVDCHESVVEFVAKTMHEVCRDVPKNFQALFGHEFNLPIKIELKKGMNMLDMVEF